MTQCIHLPFVIKDENVNGCLVCGLWQCISLLRRLFAIYNTFKYYL